MNDEIYYLTNFEDGYFTITKNCVVYLNNMTSKITSFCNLDSSIILGDYNGFVMQIGYSNLQKSFYTENVLRKIHSKKITGITVNEDEGYIATYSSDKLVKVFDRYLKQYITYEMKYQIPFVVFTTSNSINIYQRNQATSHMVVYDKFLYIKKIIALILTHKMPMDLFFDIFDGTGILS